MTAELLKRICKGRAVIVIEHDMEFVKKIAHKVTVMHQGKILAEGTMEKVKNDPKVIDVYLGTEGSRTVRMLSDLRSARRLRPERGAARPPSARPTRSSPSWAATAWARPRCSRA